MFKKFSAFLLTALLMCAAFSVVSSADAACTVDISTAVEGSTLKVTVKYHSFTDEDGVVAVSGNLIYDSAVLEYMSTECNYPEAWDDKGANWSKVVSDGNAYIGVLYDSHETGHGEKDSVTVVVSFKVLKTGTETSMEYKNILVVESGDLNTYDVAAKSFTTKLEDGNTEIDVSSAPDISIPDESEEVSVPVEDSSAAESVPPAESDEDPAESADASVPATDDSKDEDKGGCGSAIATSAIILTAILGLGIGFARKRQ